jgi:hypothetical protein
MFSSFAAGRDLQGQPAALRDINFAPTVLGSPYLEPVMHENLFALPAILARYRSTPLLTQRERFLQHCAEQGYTRGGLAKIAWLLRIVARSPIATQRVVRRAIARQSG